MLVPLRKMSTRAVLESNISQSTGLPYEQNPLSLASQRKTFFLGHKGRTTRKVRGGGGGRPNAKKNRVRQMDLKKKFQHE